MRGGEGDGMRDCTGMDVRVQPGSRRAVKKPLPVLVRFAREAGTLQTLEGPVPYAAGDALLTGTAGERWPVTRERFLRDYVPESPAKGGDGHYIKRPAPVWALCMSEAFSIRLEGSNALLRGLTGDWLVQYGAGEYGIVRADIFAESYETMD